MFRGDVVSAERLFGIVGLGLAALIFPFFLCGVHELGRLAQSPAQFQLGLLLLLIGVFVLVCCGLLLCVLSRLARGPQA